MSESNVHEVKHALAEYLRAQARCRYDKGIALPGDEGNLRNVKGLHHAAEVFEGLPTDHALFERIAAIHDDHEYRLFEDGPILAAGEEANRLPVVITSTCIPNPSETF